jgi:hypothetical protein
MAISEADSKLLWGRAAGLCSNPLCRSDLTAILEKSKSYNVGEMAHIIAKSEDGPRGESGGGSDRYENLILLCPTCHRHIDKSPDGTFTIEQLRQWKKDHESAIRAQFTNIIFDDLKALKGEVSKLLLENRLLWEELGPQSKSAQDDPGSNLYEVWSFRKLDTIIPNNQRIVNLIESNIKLLPQAEHRAFLWFKIHASSFEENQYGRLDRYLTFPDEFREAFEI